MYSFRSIYFDDPPVPDRAIDIFPLDHPPPEPGLFFVHGGGWSGGTRSVYHQIMRAFGMQGIECASTAYRLSPGSLFSQIEDVREGLTIYLDDRERRGLCRRTVIAGCSAGAHLALMAALGPTPRNDPSEAIAGISVQAPALTFEPWEDMFPQIWQSMQKAVGRPHSEAPELYRKVSPIRHLTEGMPPILILHAENEHMFPLDKALKFQEAAERVGGEVEIKQYPRTEHGFFYSLDRWQQKQAFEDILAFIRKLG